MADGNESLMLMTSEEVAEALQISVRTLETWRAHGKGPRHIKVGRLARYRVEDVMNYIWQE